MLERDPRFSVCGEAADAAAAVARAIEVCPDIVLLDIRMPGSGLTALWEIASRLPQTRVVMMTVSEDESDLFSALRAGAHGYLLKDMDPRRLPEALCDVHEGATAVPRRLVSVMMEEFRDGNPRRRALTATTELEGRLDESRVAGARPARPRPHDGRDRRAARALPERGARPHRRDRPASSTRATATRQSRTSGSAQASKCKTQAGWFC